MSDVESLATQETGGIESPTSMDSTIGEAWESISKGLQEPQDTVARDVDGKFAKKELTAQEPVAKEPVEQPEKTIPEAPKPEDPNQPVVEGKKAPAGWKKDVAEAFGALPPNVQDEILRREGDFHKGIESYKQAADMGRRMEQAIAPYMQTIQKLGATPEQAVGALFKADHILRNAPDVVKQQYFHGLAKQYGVDLSQEIDPNVAALQSEVYQLRQQLEDGQRMQQSQVQQSLNSDIARFAAEPGHEHFEVVRDHMASLLQGGTAKDLKDAYAQAVWANPQTREALLAKQQETARAEQERIAKEAKKAASVNVQPKGRIAATQGTQSWDETIRAEAVRLGLAH